MSSQAEPLSPSAARRPVRRALGDGLRAALVEDPVGIVLVPLILHFPNMVLEALQARFAGELEGEALRSPAVGLALAAGWGCALAGRLLGQALVIRRTASRLSPGAPPPLDEEFSALPRRFPVFVAVFLLFWAVFLLGFLALVLPGLAILFLWGFAPQAAILEPGGVATAFARSRAALRGQAPRWLAGAALALSGLAAVAVGAGILWAGVDELFAGAVPFAAYIAAFAGVELVTVVFAAVWTALYLDLRPQGHLPRADAERPGPPLALTATAAL